MTFGFRLQGKPLNPEHSSNLLTLDPTYPFAQLTVYNYPEAPSTTEASECDHTGRTAATRMITLPLLGLGCRVGLSGPQGYIVVSLPGGLQYKPSNALVLILGTLQKVPLNLGNTHTLALRGVRFGDWRQANALLQAFIP